MCTHRRLQGKRCSHSLVTIDDLFMDDRAVVDLPNERLAIACP